MRKTLLALALGLLAVPLAADVYTIDPAHTEIGFETIHLSFAKVRGRFTDYSAKLDLNDKDLTKSTVAISIQAASANTGVEMRDNDLKTEKFFDVTKTPTITFKSSSITKNSMGGYDVMGDLSIRGVTKPVKLRAILSEAFPTDDGGTKRAFSLLGSINRFDFGLGWNKKTKTGTLVVGEQVKIDIDGEIAKEKKKKG